MNRLARKLSLLGMGLVLAGAGAGLGAVASSLTTQSLKWRPPPIEAASTTERAVVDHAANGRNWARTAFDGGLRRCPEMNPDFVAACEAEIAALLARPAFQPGSYGGPLIVTRVDYDPPEPEDAPLRTAYDEPARAPVEHVDAEPSVLPPVLEPTPVNYPAAAPAT